MKSRMDIIGQNGNDGLHYSSRACPTCKHEDHMDAYIYQEFTPSTAVYPMAGTHTIQEAMYLGLGLAGETGETVELIKKWWRDGTIDEDKIRDELGDVLWYVSQLCTCFNFSIAEVLLRNRDKLIDRQNREMLKGSGDTR